MKRLIKKALRDLLADKRRAFLSFLAMLVGMVVFGVILFSYQIIDREIVEEFNAINPASATIEVDRVDAELLRLTTEFEGIEYFEDRAFHELRVQTGENESKPLELHAAQDYGALDLNMVLPQTGSYNPASGEALIERDALSVAGIEIGDSLVVANEAGDTWEFTITGVVSDVYQHPASMHGSVYLYVSYPTLFSMGLERNMINFTVTDDPYDRESIIEISNAYSKLLEENGYTVIALEVSDTPGVSMHYEEYVSTLFLLQVFSVVMFLFGCMIMSGLVSSILSSQIRQIGILKAIGTDTKKIKLAYLIAFLCLVGVTMLVSVPITVLASGGLARVTMALSNMRPENLSVSWYLYLIYCVFAFLAPLVIAWFPIQKGIRTSVRDALAAGGIASGEKGLNIPQPKFLSRPVMLSLRNAVRRKGRFLRNVVILSVGGALFVAVISSMIATQTTLKNNLASLGFEYQVMTSTTKTEEEIQSIIEDIPYITEYESWGVSSGRLVYVSGAVGNSYPLSAPQAGSNMINPDILQGRWITDEDTNAIVVSHKFLVSEPQLAVGSTVTLQLGSTTHDFELVGVIKDLGNTTVFMSHNAFEQYVEQANQFTSLKFNLEYTGRVKTVYATIESSLREKGIGILSSESISDIYDILAGHFTVTLQTFTFIIFMLVIVSGFGLAATMNAQTSERTREMGIMKAMGAGRKQIARIVTSESVFISLVSWVFSFIAGIPLSIAGIYIFGNLIINTPLDANPSSFILAFLLWFVLTFVIGYFASRSAAKRASRLSILSCLKYVE